MQHELKPHTPNQYIKTQSILQLAFLLAMVGFAMVVSAISNGWELLWNYSAEPLILLIPIVATLGILLSKYLFQKQLDAIKKLQTLNEKLAGYQTARIIKYACIEAPALFSVVIFMHTENAFFLIIAFVLIIYFFLHRPTKEIIETDLNLNGDMRNQFQKLDVLIK